jgi:Flp pilus assembly protein TadD
MSQRPPYPISSRHAFRHLVLATLGATALCGVAAPALAQGEPLPPPPLSYQTSAPRGEYIVPGLRNRYSDRYAKRSTANAPLASAPPVPPMALEEPMPPLELSTPLPSPRRLNEPLSGAPYATGARYGDATDRVSSYYAQPTPEPIKPEDLDFLPQVPPQEPPQQPQVTPAPQPSAEPAILAAPPVMQQPAPVVASAIPQAAPTDAAVADAGLAPLPWDEYTSAPEAAPAPAPAVEPKAPQMAAQAPELVPPPQIQDILDQTPPAPETAPAPDVEATTIAALPTLSEESKKVLAKTPSGIDSKSVMRTPEPVVIKRTAPEAGNIPTLDVRTHSEMGLKIEMRKAAPNIHNYLEEGYKNLVAGHEAIAAGYYNEVLALEPNNEMALLGLGTTYQKLKRTDEARSLYAHLLDINPTHREALNNFMALLSEESPQEAIAELEKLESENPDFSPIAAQLGIVYNKIGDQNMAARKLLRALELSPDNVAYKYNLAIVLDSLGQAEDAGDLYMELIEDYNQGATLPGNVEDIRNRIIFLSSKG